MNLVKVADMLKNASDQNLIQEMQNPSGSVPSYMVLSELERRKKLRGSLMNNEPQSSVAEDMEREVAPAAAAGIGSMAPPPAQGPGYAGGGEVRGYAAGDYVGDYEDPLSWEERMRKWREMTGFGRMAPQAPAQAPQAPQVAAPAVAPATPAAPTIRTEPRQKDDSTVVRSSRTPGPTPEAQANTISSYQDELKGYRKELEGMYKNQADLYQKQYEDLKGAKDKDVSMALLTAGLGIMGGRSAYAAENIGQGALPAVQQYLGADRERQREMQKMALGQGALGIESLRARMEAAKGEGELGLKERAVGADEMKARAAMASAGAQSSYYKQAIASAKSENDAARIAASVINSSGFSMMDPKDQQFFLGMARQGLMNRFPGAATNTGPSVPTYNPQTRSW